jgi:hypothetical protein
MGSNVNFGHNYLLSLLISKEIDRTRVRVYVFTSLPVNIVVLSIFSVIFFIDMLDVDMPETNASKIFSNLKIASNDNT